jgi:hypothetical protein
MNRWFLKQVFVAVVALLVAFGLGLSTVNASVMPMHMATMQGMTDGTKSCPDCDKMNKQTGMQAPCTATCVAPSMSTVPPLDGASIQPASRFALERIALLHGLNSPPEPYPPRSILSV